MRILNRFIRKKNKKLSGTVPFNLYISFSLLKYIQPKSIFIDFILAKKKRKRNMHSCRKREFTSLVPLDLFY
jgi:hypothetical protein